MSCTVVFYHDRPGEALTLRLCDVSGNIANGTPDTLLESSPVGKPLRYAAIVSESLSGWYVAQVLDDAGLLYTGNVKVANDGGVYVIDDPMSVVAGLTVNAVLEPAMIREAMGLAAPNLDEQLQLIMPNPVGAFPALLLVQDNLGNVIYDCDVILTASNVSSLADRVWVGRTDVNGRIRPELDSGTYYGWRQRIGYQFANPFVLTVSESGEYVVSYPNVPDIGAFLVDLFFTSNNGGAVSGCAVTLTTSAESPGIDRLMSGVTDGNGAITFRLNAGTYYGWRQKTGYLFANPFVLTVNEDGSYSVTYPASPGIGSHLVSLLVKSISNDPIAGCIVSVTLSAESAHADRVVSGATEADGTVLFWLNPGSYFGWRQKSGFVFSDPFRIDVAEDGSYTVS